MLSAWQCCAIANHCPCQQRYVDLRLSGELITDYYQSLTWFVKIFFGTQRFRASPPVGFQGSGYRTLGATWLCPLLVPAAPEGGMG